MTDRLSLDASGNLGNVPGRITAMASGDSCACRLVSLEKHTVVVLSSQPFPLETLVKIEGSNRIWMGEVWASESDENGYRIEVEANNSIDDVSGVEKLATRFFHRKRISSDPLPATTVKATPGRGFSK